MMLQITSHTSTAAARAFHTLAGKHLERCAILDFAHARRGAERRLRSSLRTSAEQQCVHQISASSASAAGPSALMPQNDAVHDWRQLPLPLHERPAHHVCLLTDLRVWHQQAKQQAQQTDDAFAADNGPNSSELQVKQWSSFRDDQQPTHGRVGA